MTLDLGAINWLAVIIATLVYFLLGAVWFAQQTPIGRAWASAAAYESPTSGVASSNLFYLTPLITAFVASVATALIVEATGADTFGDGLVLGLVIGIGYAATIVLNLAAFEFSKPRQWTWGLLDASYHLVGLVVAAVILAVWR
jgi:hypothetical protein